MNIVAPARFMLNRGLVQEGFDDQMQPALKGLFFVLPFLFGIGFIAPLTAELMAWTGMAAPLGLTRLGFGLLFGGAWGLYATVRGSWL
jgi:hypothetical protein